MVSVIIPNYNHARFLKQRIETVLNQTYRDFELIILDDYSTDGSKEVIEQYNKHPKVTCITYNTKNSGSVFKQWDKGINIAKGEYIWIAESDDYAHPEFLEKMVPYLEQEATTGFVYCNSNIVSENDIPSKETFADRRNKAYRTDKWESSYFRNGREEIKENLFLGCTVNNASAVLFRKEPLKVIFPLDKDFKYIGDWYSYLNICLSWKMGYLNEALNYYREHQVNASKSMSKDLRYVAEYFYLYDWVLRNLNFIKEGMLINRFLVFTSHSGLKDLNTNKLRFYNHLYNINARLFWILLAHNTIRPYKKRMKDLCKRIFKIDNVK